MPDRALQSSEESDGMVGSSTYPYKSIWMAHWLQTSYKSKAQANNYPSTLCKIKEGRNDNNREHHLLDQLESASAIFESTEEFKQVPEVRADDMSGNKRSNYQPFPIFSLSRSRDIISASEETNRTTICHIQDKFQPDLDSGIDTVALGRSEGHFLSVLARAPAKTKFLLGDCKLQLERISENPDEKQVKSHDFCEKNSAFSSHFQGNFVRSKTNTVLYKFNGGITPMKSLMRGQELNQSTSVAASGERCNHRVYSECVVHEKKINNCFNSWEKGKQLVKEYGRFMPSRDLSHRNDQVQVIVGQPEMPSCSNVVSLPSMSCPSLITNSEKSKQCSYSLEGTPLSIPNAKGLPVASPNVSPTTHHFLIKKNTELCGEGQTISGSSTRFKGHMIGEFLGFSPNFDSHKHQRVKLQLPGTSKNDEENENASKARSTAALVSLRSESSAETGTMDISAFQDRNRCSGEVSSASCKNFMGVKLPPPCQTTETAETLPAGPSSLNEREPSDSTTQRLGAEHLRSHTEQASSSKSSPCPESTEEARPNSRWVKRLKTSPTDSLGRGTKGSRIGEALFPQKVNKFFGEFVGHNRTCSEPTTEERNGNKQMILKKGRPALLDSKKEDRGAMLSHSWIRRWRNNRSPSSLKGRGALARKPRRRKLAGEFAEHQYPSIAAMALMGKAMSGFRPCEFKNRGAFVVWNAGEFL